MTQYLTLTVGPKMCEHAQLVESRPAAATARFPFGSYAFERDLDWNEHVELVLNIEQAALLMKELAILTADAMHRENEDAE